MLLLYSLCIALIIYIEIIQCVLQSVSVIDYEFSFRSHFLSLLISQSFEDSFDYIKFVS